MIDLSELRGRATPGEFVVELCDHDHPPAGLGPAPGLIVSQVGEAVKLVGDGRVTGSLNREELWALHGFVLDPVVLAVVTGDAIDPGALIEAVRAAGLEWRVVETNPL